MLKIVFMGTPDFARKSLEKVYDAGYEILGVVTNVDKPKGRGMKMIPTPVKEFALEKSLPIYQPEKIRNNETKRIIPKTLCQFKSSCYMCCCIWKNTSKRTFRYS